MWWTGNVMFIVVEHGHDDPVQNLNEDVSISNSANTLGKTMDSTSLSTAMGK